MKTEHESRKTDASYSKQIKRLTVYADEITKSNKLRKHLIHQYNLFVKKLLDENRITKEELIPFFENRENVAKKLNIERPMQRTLTAKRVGITGYLPAGMNQILNDMLDKRKEQECLHDNFNKHLVESGQCESIEEAGRIPRMLSCPCKKCNPFTL
jgi:hypothetical protein